MDRQTMGKAPNVVIIMVDEQKANSLPLYGNPLVQTPSLERLADPKGPLTLGFTPRNQEGQSRPDQVGAHPPLETGTLSRPV
jgi:hypothetical protein